VESRNCPPESGEFKDGLKDNETFETEFIGASEEDCQKWERENHDKASYIDPCLIVIADARTAKDRTVLVQCYQEPVLPSAEEDLPWPEFGELPPPDKVHTWWSYRVRFEGAREALLDLGEFGILEADLPYYGLKDRLTDENGVFDVAKARRITMGEDYEAVLSEDPKASIELRLTNLHIEPKGRL